MKLDDLSQLRREERPSREDIRLGGLRALVNEVLSGAGMRCDRLPVSGTC